MMNRLQQRIDLNDRFVSRFNGHDRATFRRAFVALLCSDRIQSDCGADGSEVNRTWRLARACGESDRRLRSLFLGSAIGVGANCGCRVGGVQRQRRKGSEPSVLGLLRKTRRAGQNKGEEPLAAATLCAIGLWFLVVTHAASLRPYEYFVCAMAARKLYFQPVEAVSL